MSKKIIVLDAPSKSSKTPVWWKIGKYFIHQENIRSLRRMGKATVISLFKGEDLVVKVSYDKLQALLPSDNKAI
jgi:hypothetical protein